MHYITQNVKIHSTKQFSKNLLANELEGGQMNIRDIASLAGVSASTVSKVMNGKDKDISEDTKKKVLKVIEEENYVPYFKFLEKQQK